MKKVLAAAIFPFVLASCGALPQQNSGAQPALQSTARASVKTPFVYITFSFSPAVDQYDAWNKNNHEPVCQIGPINRSGAVNIDGSTLYVSTFTTANVVETFGANCGKQLPETYVDTIGSPSDIAVAGKTLYVANYLNNKQTAANIAVFDVSSRGGNFKPVRQLNDSVAGESEGVALDSAGDVFWSTIDENTGDAQVVEFTGGKMPGKVLKGTQIGTDGPGSVMIDQKSDLLLVDTTTSAIDVFDPPYTSAPVQTIALHGATLRCAMARNYARIYCMDYGNGAVDEYAYPSGTYLYSFTNGISRMAEPLGIAVSAPL